MNALLQPGRPRLPDAMRKTVRRQIWLSPQDEEVERTLLQEIKDGSGEVPALRDLWLRGLAALAGRKPKNNPLTIAGRSSRLPHKECPERPRSPGAARTSL